MYDVTFTPCYPQHIALIAPRSIDEKVIPYYLSADFDTLIKRSLAISGWARNRCMIAAGVIQVSDYGAYAWSLLSKDSGPYMLPITRKVVQVLDGFKHLRVEMRVNAGFEEGHRWARMLGFKCETPEAMRRAGFFGEDQMLYARVF